MIKQAGYTSTALEFFNPVVGERVLVFETDTLKAKLGNGVFSWNDLPYWTGEGSPEGINGILTEDNTIQPIYGQEEKTVAEGNDPRIVNGQTAFEFVETFNGMLGTPYGIATLDGNARLYFQQLTDMNDVVMCEMPESKIWRVKLGSATQGGQTYAGYITEAFATEMGLTPTGELLESPEDAEIEIESLLILGNGQSQLALSLGSASPMMLQLLGGEVDTETPMIMLPSGKSLYMFPITESADEGSIVEIVGVAWAPPEVPEGELPLKYQAVYDGGSEAFTLMFAEPPYSPKGEAIRNYSATARDLYRIVIWNQHLAGQGAFYGTFSDPYYMVTLKTPLGVLDTFCAPNDIAMSTPYRRVLRENGALLAQLFSSEPLQTIELEFTPVEPSEIPYNTVTFEIALSGISSPEHSVLGYFPSLQGHHLFTRMTGFIDEIAYDFVTYEGQENAYFNVDIVPDSAKDLMTRFSKLEATVTISGQTKVFVLDLKNDGFMGVAGSMEDAAWWQEGRDVEITFRGIE